MSGQRRYDVTVLATLDILAKSGLKAGDTVLIVCATGSVGQFLTQLASQHGLRVIATRDAERYLHAEGSGCEGCRGFHRRKRK